MKQLKSIAPDYPRIAHLCKEISNAANDDVIALSSVADIVFPFTCYVQEKLDAANVGVSWNDEAPILRNRDHVLQKGYSKIKTPAKQQFVPAWNWVHAHEGDIRSIADALDSQVTVYGEWMWATHSMMYDRLPDWFMAYDIWSVNANKFVCPEVVVRILGNTDIRYIPSELVTFNDVNEIVEYSERASAYRSGIREGIVLKTAANGYCDKVYKVVNRHFVRRDDFNDVPMVKNKLLK